jgi:hypothetical protein
LVRRPWADSWEAIADYGRTKQDFFRAYLTLPNGIPSPDTFERVFAKLDPVAFAWAFGRWMAVACQATGLMPVAIDGKSARAAKRNTATGCLHVVTAWAAENRLVLGAASVADNSNEIAAIPELLRTLDLDGAIVTIDAAGCQFENARIIRQSELHPRDSSCPSQTHRTWRFVYLLMKCHRTTGLFESRR